MKKANSMIRKLDKALTRAVATCIEGVEDFGILFSFGLDSSLVAKICEELGRPGTLYTVGVEGSRDLELVDAAREFFTSPIKKRVIDEGELEDYARRAIEIIGDCSPVQVGISIPLLIACEFACKDGKRVVLAGQGADELFAGYHRYLELPKDKLARVLEEEVIGLQRILESRDYAIARTASVDLRLPYLNPQVVRLALSIPVDLKIKNGERKYILKELAKRKGLPEKIYVKKAIQYSSGVDKALRKIAKRRGKKLKEYLSYMCPT